MSEIDIQGQTFTFSTDGTTDRYVNGGMTFLVPAGTTWPGPVAPPSFAAPVAPPVVVPEQVTRWQAMQEMLATPSKTHPGQTLFQDVLAIVTTTGGSMLLAWQNQQFLYRHGPFVPVLMGGLGLTDAEVDAMFIAAAALSP